MADQFKTRCGCAQCRISGLMGPILLITIGLIFLAGQYSRYSVWDYWPVILVVIGLVKIVEATASREGHVGQ
jgi:Domain of unknown function (DUF5668)